MGTPNYVVMDNTSLLKVVDFNVTKNTYRFRAAGMVGMFVAKKHKDKKFKFYRKKPFVI